MDAASSISEFKQLRGEISRHLGGLDRAVESLQLYLLSNPQDADALFSLAVARLHQLPSHAALSEIRPLLETAVRINPRHANALYYLGWLDEHLSVNSINPRAARARYLTVLQLAPGHAAAKARVKQLTGVSDVDFPDRVEHAPTQPAIDSALPRFAPSAHTVAPREPEPQERKVGFYWRLRADEEPDSRDAVILIDRLAMRRHPRRRYYAASIASLAIITCFLAYIGVASEMSAIKHRRANPVIPLSDSPPVEAAPADGAH